MRGAGLLPGGDRPTPPERRLAPYTTGAPPCASARPCTASGPTWASPPRRARGATADVCRRQSGSLRRGCVAPPRLGGSAAARHRLRTAPHAGRLRVRTPPLRKRAGARRGSAKASRGREQQVGRSGGLESAGCTRRAQKRHKKHGVTGGRAGLVASKRVMSRSLRIPLSCCTSMTESKGKVKCWGHQPPATATKAAAMN